METIRNKHVLLIGATGTIGSKAVELLASGGAMIYLAARNADELSLLGARLKIPAERLFQLEITSEESVNQLQNSVSRACESPDIIINCAGIGIIKPVEQLSAADFNETLNVNLTGSFLLMKAFIPGMKAKNKGLVIHIPGVLGKTPMAGAMAYAASKYGLNGMMKSLREELKRTNIRITQLFLGGVDTSFWDNIDLRVQRDKMIVAEEAARAIWFLCQQPESGVVSEMVIQPFNHQAI